MIMTKEQQDLAWASLNKHARSEIRRGYQYECKNPDYNRGFNNALELVFSVSNLTTDSEPEEMLMVERNKVQESHNHYQKTWDEDHSNEWANGICFILEDLFGDKCLPDKELNEANFTKSDSSQSSDSSHNDHPQPKFNLNEIVRVTSNDKFGTVGRIIKVDEEDDGFFYTLNGVKDWRFVEKNLEPYTEQILSSAESSKSDQNPPKPKFNLGDIVRNKYYGNGGIKHINQIFITSYGCIYEVEGGRFHEKWLEPYTKESRNLSQNTANCDKPEDNQLKDNMKEKELDLTQLLKGCEGEDIFDIEKGIVTIKEVKQRCIATKSDEGIINYVGKYIEQFPSGGARFYPSRALYEKYPLDAYSAWMEWKESRKPKFIVQAQIRLISNQGKTIEDYECVEVEVSDTDLAKATEAINEVLQKLNEKNTEQ